MKLCPPPDRRCGASGSDGRVDPGRPDSSRAQELQPLTSRCPVAFLPIAGFLRAVRCGRRVSRGQARTSGRASCRIGRTHSPTSACSSVRTGICRPLAAGQGHRLVGIDPPWRHSFFRPSSQSRPVPPGLGREVFSKLGATGTGADAVLGVALLPHTLAVLVAFVAAGQVTVAAVEESGVCSTTY